MTDQLKQVENHLSDEAKTEFKKLNKKQLMKTFTLARDIYNNSCGGCKQKMLKNPDSVKDLNDLCMKCQENGEIKYAFIQLQEIHDSLK